MDYNITLKIIPFINDGHEKYNRGASYDINENSVKVIKQGDTTLITFDGEICFWAPHERDNDLYGDFNASITINTEKLNSQINDFLKDRSFSTLYINDKSDLKMTINWKHDYQASDMEDLNELISLLCAADEDYHNFISDAYESIERCNESFIKDIIKDYCSYKHFNISDNELNCYLDNELLEKYQILDDDSDFTDDFVEFDLKNNNKLLKYLIDKIEKEVEADFDDTEFADGSELVCGSIGLRFKL